MAKTIGIATLSLADLFGQMRPHLLLLIADRYEMLAPASVALALRIPIAHIEGGEISEGAIDDAVRNAITKLSHIHFTSTHAARERVIAMGEEEWRVHRAGAPSLDYLRRRTLLSREQVEQRLALNLRTPTILVVYHPMTIAPRYARRSRCRVHGPGKPHRSNLVLLSERRCRKQSADRSYEILPYSSWARKTLHEPRHDDLPESSTSGRYFGWELKQRNHGGCFFFASGNKRWVTTTRARAGAKFVGCRCSSDFHS